MVEQRYWAERDRQVEGLWPALRGRLRSGKQRRELCDRGRSGALGAVLPQGHRR